MNNIFIDKLKKDSQEKIIDSVEIEELGIKNEKELIFKTPIEVNAIIYKANEELIINLNLKFSIEMPCKICNEFIEKKIKVKNLYITERLKNIKIFYDLKEEIKNVCFLQIPDFVECKNSCKERQNIKKYLKKKQNFPFSNLRSKNGSTKM